MKNVRFVLAILFVGGLAVFLTTCGSSGSGGGSSSGTTGTTLEINGPSSNPPAVLAGDQTSVTISAYVSGSYVELQKFDGANYIKVGEMKDDGQNGDQTAGDKVYAIQITANESAAANITYRIRATNNGHEQTREISIPVVHIPALATNTELNQTTNDLFLIGLETKALLTSLNTNIANTPSGAIDRVGDNLLTMFSNFEAITNQDFGFKLFGLAKEAKSVSQLMDIFSENPFDPRVSSVKQGVIGSGCLGEADLTTVSDLERRLCARYYLFNGTINPDGEGVQFLNNSQKVIVKEILSEPTSLVGDGISSLFRLGALGKFVVKEILGQGVGIIVDWFLDNNGEQNILIGQVRDAEEFSMPSGTHNVLYSFGGDKSKAVVKNINVSSQQTTTIEFSPGTIIEQDISPPSFPTGLTATAVSSLQIDLAWTAATDNIGVAGYNIYRGGTFLKAVTTISTSDIGLSPSAQYCYSVSAYDAAGNESGQSSQVCATTPASSTFAGTIQLPQTGQTTCYDASGVAISCAGTGQNGDIRAGVAWPNPRFTDNGDGTATDNLTGLMWVKDANIMKTRDPGYDIDGTAGDGAVTWQHALDYIKKLNQENYLGHNDWRLPNINELTSLVNNGLLGTSTWLNSQGFTNVRAGWNEYSWSSTNFFVGYGFSGTTLYAWCVSPQYNYVGPFNKISAWYVWPVRTGQSLVNYPATGQNKCYNESGTLGESFEISCVGTGQDGEARAGVPWPNPRFTDNSNGTITDNLTGLMWVKDANLMKTRDPGFDTDGDIGDGAVTWQHALDYIKKLNQENYLGYSDWRLPNINELTSLVNYGLSPTSTWLSSQGFTIDLYAAEYWSSTSSIADTASGALIVHMLHGYVSDLLKNPFFCYAWPVRTR